MFLHRAQRKVAVLEVAAEVVNEEKVSNEEVKPKPKEEGCLEQVFLIC